jgi:Xaa-Pro aminopeptidase
MPAETAQRRNKLARKLFKRPLDALLIGARPNIRYLTGFDGSAGWLLLEAARSTLFVDGRYGVQAAAQTSAVEVEVSSSDPLSLLLETVAKRRLRRLGFERNRLPYATYEKLRERRFKLTPLDAPVEENRAVKSEAEIEAIRRSLALNSEALERALRGFRATWTERRLAAEIDYQSAQLGATAPAFETIVASGPHGALPHARPRPLRIARKSLIVVDHGAILDAYASDMTRMLSIGEPPREQCDLVAAVLVAQQAAIAAVKPGRSVAAVDRAARKALAVRRLDHLFVHSTGHGLGLEIHESPRLGARDRTRLKQGMAITIEPGVYLEGVGGVRIEDVVVVRKSGAEVLTQTPRELRVL